MRGERSWDANLNFAAHLCLCFSIEPETYYGGSRWGDQAYSPGSSYFLLHTCSLYFCIYFPTVELHCFCRSLQCIRVYRLNREQKVKALDRVTKPYLLFLKPPHHVWRMNNVRGDTEGEPSIVRTLGKVQMGIYSGNHQSTCCFISWSARDPLLRLWMEKAIEEWSRISNAYEKQLLSACSPKTPNASLGRSSSGTGSVLAVMKSLLFIENARQWAAMPQKLKTGWYFFIGTRVNVWWNTKPAMS